MGDRGHQFFLTCPVGRRDGADLSDLGDDGDGTDQPSLKCPQDNGKEYWNDGLKPW